MPAIDHDFVSIPEVSCDVGVREEELDELAAVNSALAVERLHEAWSERSEDDDDPFWSPLPPEEKLAAVTPDAIERVLATWARRRSVRVRAFEVDRMRVTNRQYEVFVRETGRRPPPSWPEGRIPAGGERWAVCNVSHKDAFSYAEWAGLEMIREDEWLIAAGAADGRRYPWGDVTSKLLPALFDPDPELDPSAHRRLASPYGVTGLISATFEWCWDAFEPPHGVDPDLFRAIFHRADSSFRALRGGYTHAQQWSVHTRVGNAPSATQPPYGFRCVRRASIPALATPPPVPEITIRPSPAPALDDRARWVGLLHTNVSEFNAARAAVSQARIDLRGADLRGVDLRRAHIGECDLSGADLRGALVTPLTISTCRLEGTQVEGLRADDQDSIERVLLVAAIWRDAAWFNAHRPKIWMPLSTDFSGCRFDGVNLERAWLTRSRLEGADFTRARLIKTDFARSDLRGARFSGNTLADCVLEHTNLDGARFVGCVLDHTSIPHASMRGSHFQHARVEGAYLIATDARAASFTRATLEACRFHAVDLRGADFRGASFDDVRIERGDATGADLGGVYGAPAFDRVEGAPRVVVADRARGEDPNEAIRRSIERLRESSSVPRAETIEIDHPDVDELVLSILAAPEPYFDVAVRSRLGESSRALAFGAPAVDALLVDARTTAIAVLESIELSLESLRR